MGAHVLVTLSLHIIAQPVMTYVELVWLLGKLTWFIDGAHVVQVVTKVLNA